MRGREGERGVSCNKSLVRGGGVGGWILQDRLRFRPSRGGVVLKGGVELSVVLFRAWAWYQPLGTSSMKGGLRGLVRAQTTA